MRRGILGNAIERRASALGAGVGWSDPAAIPPNSAYSRQIAGVVVNERTALTSTAMLACLRLVTGIVGQLPLEVFERKGDTNTPVQYPPDIVANPYDEVDRGEGFEMTTAGLMLRGNGYDYIVGYDKQGYPNQLEPIAPTDVIVKRVNGTITYQVRHQPVPAERIVHTRWLTLPGGILGLSPVEMAAQSLGISLAADEYGARFFSQGASIGGIISTEGELTPESSRRVRAQFAKRHRGLLNSHLPLFIEGGVKFTPTQIPPDQAQFLATRSYGRSEIAMLYGVPPHLIGDVDRTTSWGAGIQDQKMDFLTFTIMRYLQRFESAWNKMTPPQLICRFNVDSLVRANQSARYQAYMIARTGNWLSVNEIRSLEGLPPKVDPDGVFDFDSLMTPLNSAQNGSLALSFGGSQDPNAPAPSPGSGN